MSGFVGRVCGVLLAALLALIIAYASRFWPWSGFWSTEGAFGVAWLHPSGDWVRRMVRGTAFARFDLLIWGGLVFGLLSMTELIVGMLNKPDARGSRTSQD